MVCLKLVKTKSLLGQLRYKSFFYWVNQLETDNSRPPTGTSPSEDDHVALLQILKKKLEQKEKNADVQPNDPGSPFYSVKSFEVLTP